MSQALSTPTLGSSSYQLIFDAALNSYKEKTKFDLLTHPLAAQIQACNSPDDVLVILQDSVEESDRLSHTDQRLSHWLNPTINILYAFSATMDGYVGLVSLIEFITLLPRLNTVCRYSHPRK